MRQRRSMIMAAGMACGMLCQCAWAGNWNVPTHAKDLKNPTARDASTRSAAQAVYADHCVSCHGIDSAGDGTAAKVEYDLRSILGALTDGELYWKITHGVGKMPSYAGVLSDRERWLVINHLRVLAAARGVKNDSAAVGK